MSTIIGDGNPLVNFTLSPGSSTRIWWYGFGGASIGFPVNPVFFQISNRLVAINHGMEAVNQPDFQGPLYTVDVTAEDTLGDGSPAAYRIQIGNLV